MVKRDEKWPNRELPPDYLRRLDATLKHPEGRYGQQMHRGKRYAIFDQYMGSAEKHARAIANDIRMYSPYGAAAFKAKNGYWSVGIRSWK